MRFAHHRQLSSVQITLHISSDLTSLHLSFTITMYEINGRRFKLAIVFLLEEESIGCVTQLVLNVCLWPANFPCPTLDLQLMGDHYCG